MTATAVATKTTSADRVLDVFRDFDSATAKEIVAATGLGRTTVNDNLRKLATSGDVIRMDRDGASFYSLTPTRKAANKRAAAKLAKATAKTAPKVTVASSQTPRPEVSQSTETPRTGRRTKGVIDAQILDLFHRTTPKTWGSYSVAKEIGSSAGAAYVALKRMDSEGTVRLVSTSPDRYALPA